ncbi:MAG: sugar nucleotide-binding protein [Verrucomicrobia bacterium]|nr:sugar nucleotide-binding protein [Verrucomicrobiota bacterium]
MRVFVLGHNGMLGHVVARFLEEQGCEVVTSPLRYHGAARDPLVETVRDSGSKWIVNALGRIKQKTEDPADLYLTNSVFPLHLSARMRSDQRLIHASSDCVFSGHRGSYAITDERDPEDIYGLSKALGEAVAQPGRCWVVRTSMIGPELGKGWGLMGWFLRQTGEVNGYTNHFWNGLTTLEWAKIAWQLMNGQIEADGPLIQAGTRPAMSKCDVLRLIGKVWSFAVNVRPVEAKDVVDRTLLPTLKPPELEQQLGDLRTWYKRNRPGNPPHQPNEVSAAPGHLPTL